MESSSRRVIEQKLLTALGAESTVAILASKQDLDVLIAALEYAMLGRREQTKKARELAAGMRQLRREAFPPKPWPPTGFQLAAVHAKRGHTGPMAFSFANNKVSV